jgi:DUF2971 family protein
VTDGIPPDDREKLATEAVEFIHQAILLPPIERVRSLKLTEETVPVELFHFTSIDGLMGILSSRAIWATLATALNDPSETRYALRLTDDVLDSLRDVRPPLARSLRALLHDEPLQTKLRPLDQFCYVTSFCETKSVASQWLSYGRNGTGVAISFLGKSLAGKSHDLVRVIYDTARQRELISDFLAASSAGIDRIERELYGGHAEQGLVDLAAHMVLQAIKLVSPVFKAPAFIDEREVRLILYAVPQVADAT